MGIGLAIVRWPFILSTLEDWPLAQSVVDSLLAAMGLLALLDLRNPTRMLPVLVLESTWKMIWLTAVALPAAATESMDAATTDVAVNCALGVVIIAVVPWRFAWHGFVATKGRALAVTVTPLDPEDRSKNRQVSSHPMAEPQGTIAFTPPTTTSFLAGWPRRDAVDGLRVPSQVRASCSHRVA